MVGAGHISEANKHIHSCDQLMDLADLSPKLLVRVLTHARDAIECSARAASFVLDDEQHDTYVVFKMLHETVPSSTKTARVYEEICTILDRYRSASTVLTKGESLVLADESFKMTHLSKAKVQRILAIVKRFVYETGRMVLVV